MRMSLRLIFSLVVGVTLLSFLFAVFRVRAEKRGQQRELENRAAIVGDNLEGKVDPCSTPVCINASGGGYRIGNQRAPEGNRDFRQVRRQPGRNSRSGGLLARRASPGHPGDVQQNAICELRHTRREAYAHLHSSPPGGIGSGGALAVFHDASFIKAQTSRLWWETFLQCSGPGGVHRPGHAADYPLEHRGAHCPRDEVGQGNPRGQARGAVRAWTTRTFSNPWRRR